VIGSTSALRVYAFTEPVDMRKGYNGLEQLVRERLRRDLLEGDLFLFVSRNRKRAKVLLFDGTGLCIYMKRLEKRRFARIRRPAGRPEFEMTTSELSLFLEGSEYVGRRRLSPSPLEAKDLAPFTR
jgi:transposase